MLEGLKRNTGVHAAGVVISDRDLSEYVPLTRANDGSIVSQYSMAPLGDLGMLKMDFLGLKTLTVIRDAETLIRARQPDFDIDKIPLDDPKVFELLNRGGGGRPVPVGRRHGRRGASSSTSRSSTTSSP